MDWKLPRLHQLDNGSQKMSHKLLQKKAQSKNIKISTSNFTEKEQSQIKKNWKMFCEVILLNQLLVCKLGTSSLLENIKTNQHLLHKLYKFSLGGFFNIWFMLLYSVYGL